jgi:hypothetical protein
MSIIHTTPDQLRKNLSSFIRVSGAKEMPGDIEEFLKKCDQAMLDQEALFYLDRMTAWIESAKRDLKDAAMVAAKLESEPDSKSHPVAMIFLSGLPKGLQRISNNSGFVRATEAALAVERYRNANNGNLPDSLEQLVPQQLREIPSDPFDGKPIRYKRLAQGGYATYSIGPDMKDNDAMPSPSLGQLGRPGSDLVFAVQR